MRKHIVILLIIIAATACSEKKSEPTITDSRKELESAIEIGFTKLLVKSNEVLNPGKNTLVNVDVMELSILDIMNDSLVNLEFRNQDHILVECMMNVERGDKKESAIQKIVLDKSNQIKQIVLNQ